MALLSSHGCFQKDSLPARTLPDFLPTQPGPRYPSWLEGLLRGFCTSRNLTFAELLRWDLGFVVFMLLLSYECRRTHKSTVTTRVPAGILRFLSLGRASAQSGGDMLGVLGLRLCRVFFSVTWCLIGINFREQAGSGPWWLVEVLLHAWPASGG